MKFINGDVQWGIVGCGDVCEVKSGPAFSKVDRSKLVAVMRRDEAKARDFAMRHGVRKYYSDAQTLIDDPEVNAIYIATPPAQHEAYAIDAMKAGKPVYIEKPVSLDASSCQRLIDASVKYRVPVSVAHYRRGLLLFKKVKSILAEGTIGPIRLILIHTLQNKKNADVWRVDPTLSGGGHFHDLSPHQLDLMYWFFGKPKSVKGFSLNQSGAYQAPDLTTLDVEFEDSALLRGTWSFNVHDSAEADTCEIIGESGMLKFSFFKGTLLELRTPKGTHLLEFANPVNIQHPMINSVVKYFRGTGENPCSLEDALVTMKMIDSTVGK